MGIGCDVVTTVAPGRRPYRPGLLIATTGHVISKTSPSAVLGLEMDLPTRRYAEDGTLIIELSGLWLFFLLLMAVLAILCLLAGAHLLRLPHRQHASRPLATVFFILAFVCTPRILQVYDVFARVPALEGLYLPTLFLVPPLLWAFGRGMVQAKAPPWRWRTVIHGVPGLLFLAGLVPLFGDPEILQGAPFAALGAARGRALRINDVIWFTYWTFFLQFTGYAALILVDQLQSWVNLRHYYSFVERARVRRTCYVLLWVFVPWFSLVVQFIVTAVSGTPYAGEPWTSLFRIVCLAGFAVYTLRASWLFDVTPQETTAREPPPRYHQSGLDPAARVRIAAKLDTVMAERHLYRDSTLTLRQLSDATGVSENHLSETLNLHLGQNFFDYVNGWRVKEAEVLLRTTDQSVLNILLEVGFNARSTFNTAFRKRHGMPPSAYRQQKPTEPGETA